MFEIDAAEQCQLLIPCIVFLKISCEYKSLTDDDKEMRGIAALEPTTQGSVLVQSLFCMTSPHNQIVIDR